MGLASGRSFSTPVSLEKRAPSLIIDNERGILKLRIGEVPFAARERNSINAGLYAEKETIEIDAGTKTATAGLLHRRGSRRCAGLGENDGA
jgi:hypothetical protein